jgi:hypothetical protein
MQPTTIDLRPSKIASSNPAQFEISPAIAPDPYGSERIHTFKLMMDRPTMTALVVAIVCITVMVVVYEFRPAARAPASSYQYQCEQVTTSSGCDDPTNNAYIQVQPPSLPEN